MKGEHHYQVSVTWQGIWAQARKIIALMDAIT